MAAIETLAAIFAILVLLKIIVTAVSPKTRIKLGKSLLKNKTAITVVYLILAAIVGKYLLKTLSIIEISAVMLFTFFLIGISFIPFADDMLKAVEKAIMKDYLKKNWLALIIWTALALWTLYALYA